MSHLAWTAIGEAATVVQLTGLDSVKIIALIVSAAHQARMHKKNCKQFAQHLKLIGNLLQRLKLSELRSWPETCEPLDQLEDALRRAFLLVNSCKDKSYLYLLALGWSTVAQFKECQAEIDRLLGLIPLITLVEQHRERLRAIENDERVYTLDEKELQVHEAVLKPQVSEKEAKFLERSLSKSYPGMGFSEIIKKEKNKLTTELQQMEECMEMDKVEVIQHLIEVTETVLPQSLKFKEKTKLLKQHSEQAMAVEEKIDEEHVDAVENCHSSPSLRCNGVSPLSSEEHSAGGRQSSGSETWHNSLYDCCADPYLCMSTCVYPCGTFSDVASFASDGKLSPREACNDLMTYSMMFCCFCHTCCIRRRLRKRYNIEGDCCEDLCTHMMCCCCALVQEWREILSRDENVKLSPPPTQTMKREEQ